MADVKKPNYRKLHNESGILIGDVVKVIRNFKNYEQGCELPICEDLDKYIGKTFIVRYDKALSGFGLYNPESGNSSFFPCFCLEKQNDRNLECRYTLFGVDITDIIPADIRKKINKYVSGQITGINF
jgi:hypothetical protein